jgi:homoserine dehydrogenase
MKPEREVRLIQLGVGNVGRELIRQVLACRRIHQAELGLRLNYVALADIQGAIWKEDSLSDEDLHLLAQEGAQGLDRLGLLGKTEEVVRRRTGNGEGRMEIVVDVTAADTSSLLLAALKKGCSLVLANKIPLASALSVYRRLTANRQVRYETTVGAGLPVVDTLQKLLDTGDEVRRIQGCFSGTLGYICSQLDEDVPFSAAVQEARQRGYTEPDPRDDLAGTDVARKALILARLAGYDLETTDVVPESLFPMEMRSLSVEEFMAQLGPLDEGYRRRVAAASSQGNVLRYVAEVEGGHCQVRLTEMPRDSLMGALRGPDNIVSFQTERYTANPLTIIGPGAGPAVTAAGVLGDILALAREVEGLGT